LAHILVFSKRRIIFKLIPSQRIKNKAKTAMLNGLSEGSSFAEKAGKNDSIK
jgi:hypothetical protein